MLQACPMLKKLFVEKAQLDTSLLNAKDGSAICDEIRSNHHDNDCHRAFAASSKDSMCDDFVQYCNQYLPDIPSPQDCPVWHSINKGNASVYHGSSIAAQVSNNESNPELLAICNEWSANTFNNSCFNATAESKLVSCIDFARLCMPGVESPCHTSPCISRSVPEVLKSTDSADSTLTIFLARGLRHGCPLFGTLIAYRSQMDASLLSETDRLHICEEWSADKFNNDCSRHVLELDRNQTLSNIQGTIRNETSDFSKVESAKSICLGYMQLCQVPRFKTPCPNHEKIPNWDPSISAEHPECEESR